eukprot:5125740-Amphidinium_carterae.1
MLDIASSLVTLRRRCIFRYLLETVRKRYRCANFIILGDELVNHCDEEGSGLVALRHAAQDFTLVYYGLMLVAS